MSTTGFGTRSEVEHLIAALTNALAGLLSVPLVERERWNVDGYVTRAREALTVAEAGETFKKQANTNWPGMRDA